jgi:hypothetical protein
MASTEINFLGHTTSIGIIFGTLSNALPHIAAIVSITWYSILIYDRYKKGRQNETTTKAN